MSEKINGSGDSNRINRRNFLSATAATGSLLGIPSVVGARVGPREKFRNGIDASLKKREKTNDYDGWVKYLKKRGYGVQSKGANWKFGQEGGSPMQNDDGVSTMDFPVRDLGTKITLIYDCDQGIYYGETAFEYDWSNGTGDNPIDHAAVAWTKDTWFLDSTSLSESTRTSGFVFLNEEEGFSGIGAAYNVYDASVWWNGQQNKWYYGGVYMRPANDGKPESDRYIQGAYNHNWEDIDVSFSLDADSGISVTPSNQNFSWVTRTKSDQDTLLRLYQNEATYPCGIE